MNKKIHFNHLNDYLNFIGVSNSKDPLFSIFEYNSIDNKKNKCENIKSFSSDFYTISLKKIVSGEVVYGLTPYDYTSGTLIFSSPEQEINLKNVSIESKGLTLVFHKSLLNLEAFDYSFFDYSFFEALHLSEKEEEIISSILKQIYFEHNNNDNFSLDLIINYIQLILTYSDRFFHRQTKQRKEKKSLLRDLFNKEIKNHFNLEKGKYATLPNVDIIAKKLGFTTRNLTDKLKFETGQTAIELIHSFLMLESKRLLLNSNDSISTIAYSLGFDYPQYFSRLFKKKVGLTPAKYRKINQNKRTRCKASSFLKWHC